MKSNKGYTNAALILFLVFICMFPELSTSQIILTRDEFIQRVGDQHPALTAQKKLTEAANHEKRTAFSLPNPSIGIQSPTGQFYAVGVNQNFDFPGVYVSRRKMLTDAAALQGNYALLEKQIFILEASKAFHEARYHASLAELLHQQDTLLRTIYEMASTRFIAGDIDFLEKSFAELEYGQVHQNYVQAMTDYENSMNLLKYYISSTDSISVLPFLDTEWSNEAPDMVFGSIHSIESDVVNSQVDLSKSQLRVEKNKSLPGIQLGYLNQSGKETPVNMRWQIGLTIPLWFWQYSGSIKAAKAREEAMIAQQSETNSAINTAGQNAMLQWGTAQSSLKYHLKSSLPVSKELATAAQRYFNQGETSYTTYLRTLRDILNYRLEFARAAYQYSLATEELNYYFNTKQ
ncbi:MAG: TolC family protein [Flavobacteriales bacterium]|nr:TolC family protein [Flavobacteriales bacterium]